MGTARETEITTKRQKIPHKNNKDETQTGGVPFLLKVQLNLDTARSRDKKNRNDKTNQGAQEQTVQQVEG